MSRRIYTLANIWIVFNYIYFLTPIQRIAIAEKYRPIIEKKAKENLSKGGGDKKSGLTNSTKAINEPVNTRDKLARIAGVGQDTYYKGKRILDSDNEEIKNKLKNKSRAVKALLLIFIRKINTKYGEAFLF